MTPTEYPHEWIWRKIRKHDQILIIWTVATITVLLLGCITFWVALNYPSATFSPQMQTLNQPSAFSYAPIIITIVGILIGLMVFPHCLDKGEV